MQGISKQRRPPALDTAGRLVAQRYPSARAAFLGGSASIGRETSTSDLDIVVVGDDGPRRESLIFEGWPVEAFVHTEQSLRGYFASDAKRRQPTMPTLCGRGIKLRNVDGLADVLASEAQQIILNGPEPLTRGEIDAKRYAISDAVDDLRGSGSHEENLFTAAWLIDEVASLALISAGHWRGRSKWSIRLLREHNPVSADAVVLALHKLTCSNNPAPLIEWAEGELRPIGGRLWDGYTEIASPHNDGHA